jgi:hypothetical protein
VRCGLPTARPARRLSCSTVMSAPLAQHEVHPGEISSRRWQPPLGTCRFAAVRARQSRKRSCAWPPAAGAAGCRAEWAATGSTAAAPRRTSSIGRTRSSCAVTLAANMASQFRWSGSARMAWGGLDRAGLRHSSSPPTMMSSTALSRAPFVPNLLKTMSGYTCARRAPGAVVVAGEPCSS